MSWRKLSDTWEALGRQDPLWAVLTDAERQNGKWDAAAFFATGLEEMEELRVTLDRLGLRLGGQRALDFGCGVGRITQALAAYFPQVDGVDISTPMLEQARRFNRQPNVCHFKENKTPDLSQFPDGTFDFVYSRIVLQHMPATLAAKYLFEFARVLRPEGVLFFQIPAGWDRHAPELYEKLRHQVTITRAIYKMIRRIVMLDWAQFWRRIVCRRPRLLEMEMHSIPVAGVVGLLERVGLQIMRINRDDACGQLISSYNYIAVKPRHPAVRIHGDWAWSRVSKARQV